MKNKRSWRDKVGHHYKWGWVGFGVYMFMHVEQVTDRPFGHGNSTVIGGLLYFEVSDLQWASVWTPYNSRSSRR